MVNADLWIRVGVGGEEFRDSMMGMLLGPAHTDRLDGMNFSAIAARF